uniref:microsomal glutathione S-transferase 1-like isoform X2 n=1 Tax=Solea senegalensis TaxID=28829 RepID=UPI001CD8964D|nr:microsomal glutathione S-transferase 1-like isoform X2 [Solea senegalensis]
MADLMENEVLRAFATYAAIVIVKMMLMGPITAYFRVTRGAFAHEEDVARKSAEEKKKLLRTDPEVERVRSTTHRHNPPSIHPSIHCLLLYPPHESHEPIPADTGQQVGYTLHRSQVNTPRPTIRERTHAHTGRLNLGLYVTRFHNLWL